MDYREKLRALGIELGRIRGRQGKTLCPKCSHTRKNKNDRCLSVNVEEGWWRCHHCEFSGNVRERFKKQKEYKRPRFVNQTDLPNDVLAWFINERGIKQETLIGNKNVKSGYSMMPQTGNEEKTIQFNYYRKGELINIKHRDDKKNFKLEYGAELIFYGLDDIRKEDNAIYVVEGEIDKLSAEQAGITSVISVPNGASKGSNVDLEYLDNCYEYFDNDKIIVLCTDNDEAGIILREELSRRLGKHRCRKVDLGEHKDLNDVLRYEGGKSLFDRLVLENTIEYQLEGVTEIDDIWDEVNHIMEHGLKPGIKTHVFHELDKKFTMEPGRFCMVTGVPNSGKSPFTDQMALLSSIRHGWKWGIASMETKPTANHYIKLAELTIGSRIRPGRPLSEDKKEMFRDFARSNLFMIEANYDDNEVETLDFILTAAEGLVKKNGIRGLIIDPWNKIEHQRKAGESETDYVSRTLDKILRFAQKNSVFVFLIAHPTKPPTNKEGWIPDLYSISGSSNFYNKPDYGITIHRNYESKLTEVIINKMKWDHLGKIGSVKMKYNPNNGRLGDNSTPPDDNCWLYLETAEEYQKNMDSLSSLEVDESFFDNTIQEGAPF